MELDVAKSPVGGPISDFKMLTLASETSIYGRTAEINYYYLMTLCFAVCSLNVLELTKTSVIFQ